MLSNPFNRYFYICAYLLVLYVRPHEFSESTENWPVLMPLLAIATLLWMVRQEKNWEAPQFRLVPVILVIAILSVVFTGWFGGGLEVFQQFTPVILPLFLLGQSIDNMDKLRKVFFVLAVSAAAVAAHGVVQFHAGQAWSPVTPIKGRITYLGFLNDPNDLAMFLLMVLPMVMYLRKRAGFIGKLFYLAVAVAILLNVFFSNSRGAVLALGSMLLMYSIWRYGLWKSLFVVPFLMLPLVLLAPDRMSDVSASEESAEGRVDAWYEGFQMLREHPFFGVGKGMFVDHHHITAHNSFVQAVSELGVVGFYFWLSNLVVTWMMLRRVDALRPDPADSSEDGKHWVELHAASRALLVGLVGGLVCSFFLSRAYVVVLWVHIGLVIAVFQMARLARGDELPAVTFKSIAARMIPFTLLSVVGLWLITRILLQFG